MAYVHGARIIRFTPTFPPFVFVYHIVLTLVRLFDWTVYGIRVRGRENLRSVDRAILVSNHTLLLDPGIIAHALRPRRTYFTMLEETALIPWLGTFVRLLGGVPIPERPDALRILDTAARRAFSGLGFLHFFPEGECFRGNQVVMPFRSGAFLLACRLGVPVIPVTTVLRERTWQGRSTVRLAGREIRLPPKVIVVLGEPVCPPLLSDGTMDERMPRTAVAERMPRTLVADARRLSAAVRTLMQEAIDREGGCKSMYRGMMPRLVKRREAAATARPLAHPCARPSSPSMASVPRGISPATVARGILDAPPDSLPDRRARG